MAEGAIGFCHTEPAADLPSKVWNEELGPERLVEIAEQALPWTEHSGQMPDIVST
jgi:hypothetical protein